MMKRILLSIMAFMILTAVNTSAQVRFGVTGGLGWNKSKFNFTEMVKEKAPAGWNAGLTMSVDLPLGFSVQPSLLYHQKEAMLTDHIGQSMGYLELPVSVQWGPDLLVFRPFLDCTPYIGYALSNKTYTSGAVSIESDNFWTGKQRVEYGLGLGGGIEVWRFQIVARYNWNFGRLFDDIGSSGALKDHLSNLDRDSGNFGGVTLGLALFF
jgi:hypothetical protein